MSAPTPEDLDALLEQAREVAATVREAYREAYAVAYDPMRSADGLRGAKGSDPTAAAALQRDPIRRALEIAYRQAAGALDRLHEAARYTGATKVYLERPEAVAGNGAPR